SRPGNTSAWPSYPRSSRRWTSVLAAVTDCSGPECAIWLRRSAIRRTASTWDEGVRPRRRWAPKLPSDDRSIRSLTSSRSVMWLTPITVHVGPFLGAPPVQHTLDGPHRCLPQQLDDLLLAVAVDGQGNNRASTGVGTVEIFADPHVARRNDGRVAHSVDGWVQLGGLHVVRSRPSLAMGTPPAELIPEEVRAAAQEVGGQPGTAVELPTALDESVLLKPRQGERDRHVGQFLAGVGVTGQLLKLCIGGVHREPPAGGKLEDVARVHPASQHRYAVCSQLLLEAPVVRTGKAAGSEHRHQFLVGQATLEVLCNPVHLVGVP